MNTANWSGNAGFDAGLAGWYKDTAGNVHLEGAAAQVSTSGNANLVGTLPPAAWPNRTVYEIVHTFAGTYADLVVNTQGQIYVIDPRPPAVKDYTFVSLEGVTF